MKLACAATLVLAMGAAPAQTIYRCGPEGRELSQMPCAGGRSVELRADDPTDEEKATALDRAARDRELADRLEHDRRTREADDLNRTGRAAGFYTRTKPADTPTKPVTKKRQPKVPPPAGRRQARSPRP